MPAPRARVRGDRHVLAARPRGGDLDRAAGDDGGHRLPVARGGADVGDRLGRLRRELPPLGRAGPASPPTQRRLCCRDAPDRRRERGDRHAGVGDAAAVERDDGGRADDRDLHLPPVLEPEIAAARSPRRGSGTSTASSSSSGRGGRLARAGEELGDRDGARPAPPSAGRRRRRSRGAARRSPSPATRSSGSRRSCPARASRASRRSRPRRRAPSAARARAGAPRSRRGVASAPSRSVPSRLAHAAELVEPVDRDEPLGQRRLALARADDEVGAAGDGAGARTPARAAPPRPRTRRRATRVTAAPPRRAPASSAAGGRAFPSPARSRSRSRPASRTQGGSPIPFEPFGPPSSAGVSTQAMSIRGASAAVGSL